MSMGTEFMMHRFCHRDIAGAVELNTEYLKKYPKAELVKEEMFDSPLYEGGNNVICALDKLGRLAGYIPLQLHLTKEDAQPNMVWANMVVSPLFGESQRLQDMLLDQAIARTKEIVGNRSRHSTRLWFQYHVSEVKAIEYVICRGAVYADSVLRMVRDISGRLEPVPPRDDIEIKRWKIKTQADLYTYVKARNEAFPHMPVTTTEWEYFESSGEGKNGITIAALDRGRLVGAVSAYWSEEDNERLGESAGWTENVFVLESWRGKGIADAMITSACLYLKEQGLTRAQLDPSASNQRAVHVYKRLGYQIIDESQQYWIEL